MSVVYKRISGKEEKTESSILQLLAYFSLFQYPLSRQEIKNFLHPCADTSRFDEALENLVTHGPVFKIEDLYLLKNDISLVLRRKEGNERAGQLLPTAMKIGRFLSTFPFVRGIGISGSLSKMYADEKSDIDFFIITKPGRVWIAWAFMHLFKKLTFLTGDQNLYCMNYYIDEKTLTLKDQDIYTAMETFTLIPVSGKAISDFFAANGWVNKWFVNYGAKQREQYDKKGISVPKKMIEWLFNHKLGDRLDTFLMKTTSRRWQKKKERNMLNLAGREVCLLTDKHSARSNPGMFREKLLALYEEKITEIKYRWPEFFQDAYPNTGII